MGGLWMVGFQIFKYFFIFPANISSLDLQHCTTFIQRWQSWKNVEATLYNFISTCFNVAFTLVTAKSKPIGLVISKDLEIDKFYSAKYILQYIKSSTANQIINSYSNFVEVGHIVHNGENDDAHRSSKMWNFKT